MKYGESPEPPPIVVEERPLSMLELRQNAADVMDGLNKGVHYSLTYRGKTVGKLVPPELSSQAVPAGDAINHLEDFISDGPEASLTNEDIDRVLYGL